MITELRCVYHEHGHVDSWTVRYEYERRVSHGSPCESNKLLYRYRQAHTKKISTLEVVVHSASLPSAELVIEHGKKVFVRIKVQ